MSGETIAGLGSKDDFVAPVPNVDARKLQLNDDELMVFALVGRAAQIKDVLARAGMEEPKVIVALLQLRAKGAIAPAKVQAPPKPSVTDAAAVEQVDLADERKVEILELERSLDAKNAFELLGVPNGASAADAKAAFYALSRKFHPDRYFGKNLGSFRGRIEKIFRRLTQAHEQIGDDSARAEYLKKHPELAPKVSAPEVAAEQPRPRTDEDDKREAERRARFSRHPYLVKGNRVAELLVRAKSQIAKGQFGHAFTDLNMAAQLDPRNEEVKTLLADVRHKNEIERSNVELKRGLDLLEQHHPTQALAAFKMAVGIHAGNGKAAHEAAKIIYHAESNVKEASSYAQKAVDAEPKNAGYHLFLARLLDEAGLKALSKKHYEEALKLDPNNAEAKKQVKGRWPF